MLIEKLTNEIDGIEARIIQRESDKKYLVELWDPDADLRLGGGFVYMTPFLDLARKRADELAHGIGPSLKLVD